MKMKKALNIYIYKAEKSGVEISVQEFLDWYFLNIEPKWFRRGV